MDTLKMVNPWNEKAMFVAEKAMLDESALHTVPFIHVQVHIPQLYQSSEASVKVAAQSFEAIYDSGFFGELLYFYEVYALFQFQHDRADTAFIFLVDSAHDLGITFYVEGFRSITSKFPRTESFSDTAELTGSKFSLSEILNFYHDATGGLVCVKLEKTMDALCGAREICLFVPFLLYNCTGLLLTIIDNNAESKGSSLVISSCYHMIEHGELSAHKQGLPLSVPKYESFSRSLDVNGSVNSFSKGHVLFNRENLYSRRFPGHSSVNDGIISFAIIFSSDCW